jgi:hypothetical protein
MRLRAALACLLLLSACSDSANSPSTGVAEEPAQAELLRTPFAPFPEATDVRLFISETGPDGPFVEPAGRRLSVADRSAFEQTLAAVTYSAGPSEAAACYVPHHFFRYFNDAGQEVGEVAICFCCKEARLTPDTLPAGPYVVLDFDEPRLREVIAALSLPTDVGCN